MVKNENFEIKRIIDIIKEKAFIMVFIIIVFILLGYMYTYYYVQPKYKATETLLLIPNNTQEEQVITSADLTLNSSLISTYSNIAKQSKVLKQVIKNLNLNITEQELLSKLQVNTIVETYILEISISDINPQVATEITKEISKVFLKEVKNIYNLENIGIVDEAEVPQQPYNINHIRDIVISLLCGIVICGVVILGIAIFDNTIKKEEDIENYVEMKVLGKIPVNPNQKVEIANRTDAKSYVTECINTIRTNIMYMNSVKSAKVVLVTSCRAQDGKSWVSSNIATSFAETNKKVLLIDADLRKGRTNKIFNIENKEGLSNYLNSMSEEKIENLKLAKEYIKETKIPNLHILTNGNVPPNPAELLESKNMKELIELLKNVYDVIIIDSPPCMLVTDSAILSTIVDSTVLVVNSGNTKIKDLLEVKKAIKMVGGNVIGAILNKVKIEGRIYSKNYYYGHAKSENKCEIKQREIISVNEVIENAIPKIELIQKICKESINIETKEETELKSEKVENYSNQQKEYLYKIIDIVSDIKNEVHKSQNNNIEKIQKTEKAVDKLAEVIEQKIKELRIENEIVLDNKLQGLDYKEQINKIYNEIKEQNYEEEIENLSKEIEKLNYGEEIERLTEEIEKLNYEEEIENLSEKVENLNYVGEVERLNYEKKLNDIVKELRALKEKVEKENYKEEFKENFRSVYNEIEEVKEHNKQLIYEIRNNKEIEKVIARIDKEKLTAEELQNIMQKGMIKKEEIIDIVRQMAVSSKEVQKIINKDKLTIKQVQGIIKQEIQNVDYIDKFNKLEEMIRVLNENYEELSNQFIQKENIKTKENIQSNENIIDIDSLRKDKQTKRKKRTYSIYEDIDYRHLEQTAMYVIPLIPEKSSEKIYG